MTIAAYGLGHLAGMDDQRRANVILGHGHYDKTASRDFEYYARMSAGDLLAELNARQSKLGRMHAKAEVDNTQPPTPTVTGHGAGKLAVLQIAREHPQMKCAAVARLANVHYQYAWKILKRVRGRR